MLMNRLHLILKTRFAQQDPCYAKTMRSPQVSHTLSTKADQSLLGKSIDLLLALLILLNVAAVIIATVPATDSRHISLKFF
jgi:hypothetical protein